MIERSLHHVENLMLHHPRLIADGYHDVSFGELRHIHKQFAAQRRDGWENRQKFPKFYVGPVIRGWLMRGCRATKETVQIIGQTSLPTELLATRF